MPTSYTGVATATQAPSGPPVPGGAPIVSIPNDGESENAASVTQMAKVVVDWLTAAFSPRARVATISAHWVEAVLRIRSALLHSRGGFDHMGLPAGRIVHWIEDWSKGVDLTVQTPTAVDITGGYGVLLKSKIMNAGGDLQLAGVAADLAATQALILSAGVKLTAGGADIWGSSGAAASPWSYRIVKTTGSGAVTFYPPDNGTVSARHRYAGLQVGDSLNDYALLFRKSPAHFSDDLHIPLQWEAQLEDTAMGAKLGANMGFGPEDDVPNFLGAGGGTNYAAFIRGISGNWFARTASGAVTSTDTGVAATTSWTRFRIEFHGANVAEDAVRTIRYYINETLVATHTTNIPAVATVVAPNFSCVNYQGGASGLTIPLRIGPVQYAQNLYPADVFP